MPSSNLRSGVVGRGTTVPVESSGQMYQTLCYSRLYAHLYNVDLNITWVYLNEGNKVIGITSRLKYVSKPKKSCVYNQRQN